MDYTKEFTDGILSFLEEKERTSDEKIKYLYEKGEHYKNLADENIDNDDVFTDLIDIYMYCMNAVMSLERMKGQEEKWFIIY